MSWRLVKKVLDELTLPPPEKWNLAAMAEMCPDRFAAEELSQDQLEDFYMSQRQLMHRTGHCEAVVSLAVATLCRRGLVTVVRPGNVRENEAAVYRINLAAFPGCGPAWEWDLSHRRIREAQAQARRRRQDDVAEVRRLRAEALTARRASTPPTARDEVGNAGLSGPTTRDEVGLPHEMREAPARDEGGLPDESGTIRVPPSNPGAYPTLCAGETSGARSGRPGETSSGTADLPNFAPLVRRIDEEEEALETERRRVKAVFAAQTEDSTPPAREAP